MQPWPRIVRCFTYSMPEPSPIVLLRLGESMPDASDMTLLRKTSSSKRVHFKSSGMLVAILPDVTHFLRGCHHALDDRGNSLHPVGARILHRARGWRADPPSAGDSGNRGRLSPDHRSTRRLAADSSAAATPLLRHRATERSKPLERRTPALFFHSRTKGEGSILHQTP